MKCTRGERALVGLLGVAVWGAAAEPAVRFNRDIRPIMADTCFRCHGPDKGSRMMGLRLDIREQATARTKSGVTPIVPGDPAKSAIVQRIFHTDAAKRMPPAYAHKELTERQKETVRRWVAEGAAYEGHWAYQPVKRPQVPQVAGASNAIDAFIRERLAREGLKPSPEADRRTLLRRVTLDLTGLAPTPEEMAAFLADQSPDAYEKVVDRLLTGPRYAEMQAMYWLDAVRYADSAGFHGDNLWPVWPYRDYVLRAFRDNKPFDQFTREQFAGDLLPEATTEQKIASAFNRLNRASAEGGIQAKEYLAKYGADRVRTTSTVWLGATLGCAECHDHKFDPFLSRDFYSMKAFFADIRETGLIPDRGVKAWGSKLMLPSAEQAKRMKDLDQRIKAVEKALKAEYKSLEERRWEWEERTLAAWRAGQLSWNYQRPASVESRNGTRLAVYNDELVESNFYLHGSLASERKKGDGLIIASGPNPDTETYTVRLKPGKGEWTALGIDIHQEESLPGNRMGRGSDRFVLSEVEVELGGERLPLTRATTTGFGEPPGFPAMAAIDGNPRTGWAVAFGEHRNAFLALRFARKVSTAEDSVITVRMRQESEFRRANIGRFRVALSAGEYSLPETGDSGAKRKEAEKSKSESLTLNMAPDRGLPAELVKALETEDPERSDEQRKLVEQSFAWAAPELEKLTLEAAQLRVARELLEAETPRVLATERMRPRVTRVLPRANWMDETGEIVQPAVPGFLGKLDTGGRRATRLDLANWLASRDNPLTARVFVNRVWRRYFGTGISKVLEDLGSQGEWPTHPELLDWLAAEFMERWDMRHIHRLIVTSQTYRQSSAGTPQLEERDPDNRLLARQSRFRVDAEVVHDLALEISGLLKERFGGPSVRPYQPEGYLAAMNFPKREYSASHGDDLYRRAVYTQWQRTFLHPSLLTFDAPTREECTVNRVNSNTPLQALVLLNDPVFVEAARVFAQNMLASGGNSLNARLDWAYARALNRAPEKAERRILTDLYRKNLARFRADAEGAGRFIRVGEAPVPEKADAAELAALTTVARAILNLHETITRN